MEIIEDYKLHSIIGKGSYGVVYYATNESGDQFAIKQINTLKLNAAEKKYLVNEIKVLQSLDHPSIIKFYKIITEGQFKYIVTEYCSGGNLQSYLLNNTKIPIETRKNWIKTLLSTLLYLKEKNIIHRDLKLSNILLTSNESEESKIKICDFGLCKEIEATLLTESRVGSPICMAPEVLNGSKYGYKADVWSLGILCYELLLGIPPYICFNCEELKKLQKKPLMYLNQHKISDLTMAFINRMIVYDENDRADYQELLNHEFLNEENEYEFISGSIYDKPWDYNDDFHRLNSDMNKNNSENFKKIELNEDGSEYSVNKNEFFILENPQEEMIKESYCLLGNSSSSSSQKNKQIEFTHIKVIIDKRSDKLNIFQNVIQELNSDIYLIYIIKLYVLMNCGSIIYQIENFLKTNSEFQESFEPQIKHFKDLKREVDEDVKNIEINQKIILENVKDQDFIRQRMLEMCYILNADGKYEMAKFLSMAGNIVFPKDEILREIYFSVWSM